MSLSRFQIPAKRPAPEEEELESAKNLREVIRFAGAGTFYIGAIVADLQYQVYDSCPLRMRGFPCRRKLPENHICESCGGQKVDRPIKNIYLRVVLQDIDESDCTQRATMFSAVAETFLGLKTTQVVEMEDKVLYAHLEAKLGSMITAKVTIKEDSQSFTGFDWVVNRFYKTTTMKKTGEDQDGAGGAKEKIARSK
ncbi:hypothetical protein niasHT_016447 [Heterodera trifolii]|uniref:Replication factor A C-terminal domain-containing protein n=1 Tax=Heterodera trifolii TaxID=157864 RepID=A0ABD2LJ36_9BILA